MEPTEKVIAKFWSLVDRRGDDECWGWSGYSRNGYGTFRCEHHVWRAHRLSYELHHQPIPVGPVSGTWAVCHHCDNPSCTNPRHLFLGDHKVNAWDAQLKGRTTRGERAGRAGMTTEQVEEAKRRYMAGERQIDIAREFGVHQSTVSKALTGATWKHAGGEVVARAGNRGERATRAKLTRVDVVAIKGRLADGASCAELGAQYNVTPGAIWAIREGRTWRHV